MLQEDDWRVLFELMRSYSEQAQQVAVISAHGVALMREAVFIG